MISNILRSVLLKSINAMMIGGVMERIVAKILDEVFKRISPELRDHIKKFVIELEARAKVTTNPWDDLAVVVLKAALNID